MPLIYVVGLKCTTQIMIQLHYNAYRIELYTEGANVRGPLS